MRVRAVLELRTGWNRVVKRVQGAGNLVQGVRGAKMRCSVPTTAGLCKRSGRKSVNGVPATGGVGYSLQKLTQKDQGRTWVLTGGLDCAGRPCRGVGGEVLRWRTAELGDEVVAGRLRAC